MTNTPSPPRMHPLARADLKSPGGRPRSQPDLLEHTRAMMFSPTPSNVPHRSHADVARLIGAALRRDPSTLRPDAEAKVPIELVGFLRRVTRLRPRFSAGPR